MFDTLFKVFVLWDLLLILFSLREIIELLK